MSPYERFFSIASELLLVTNEEGIITSVNPRWTDVLGYEPNELVGRQAQDLIYPDDLASARLVDSNLKSSNEKADFQNRWIHKNGGAVWLRWRSEFDSKNGLIYHSGVDITAEKRATETLERLKSQAIEENSSLLRERDRSKILRQLIETSKDGFGYCDPGFKPLYLNHFLTEEFGWSTEADSFFDFASPTTRARFETEMIPAVISRGEPWEAEVEFKNTKTDELVPVWVKIFCSLGTDGKPQYVAFFATDLRTKRQSEAAILHSSKMAALGQMAAGIAHEVNNPITIINGTAGLLKKVVLGDTVDVEKITVGLERIEKTSLRISRIVKGLRMFSRSGENDPPISIRLAEILEETFDLCRERFRDFSIDLQMEEIPAVLIRCRPTQISQVLLNLLNNSFDAIATESEKWLRIEFTEFTDGIRISVTDSGPGLTEETQRRLMEPFFTTKEPGKGTGLGLPISRGIIEEHGGRLRYIRGGKNTCFAIELPCTPESATQLAEDKDEAG